MNPHCRQPQCVPSLAALAIGTRGGETVHQTPATILDIPSDLLLEFVNNIKLFDPQRPAQAKTLICDVEKARGGEETCTDEEPWTLLIAQLLGDDLLRDADYNDFKDRYIECKENVEDAWEAVANDVYASLQGYEESLLKRVLGPEKEKNLSTRLHTLRNANDEYDQGTSALVAILLANVPDGYLNQVLETEQTALTKSFNELFSHTCAVRRPYDKSMLTVCLKSTLKTIVTMENSELALNTAASNDDSDTVQLLLGTYEYNANSFNTLFNRTCADQELYDKSMLTVCLRSTLKNTVTERNSTLALNAAAFNDDIDTVQLLLGTYKYSADALSKAFKFQHNSLGLYESLLGHMTDETKYEMFEYACDMRNEEALKAYLWQ